MKLFKKKNVERGRASSEQKQKIHSYYTPKNTDREYLDMSKRTKRINRENLLRMTVVKNAAIALLLIFIAWTSLLLSDEPIISFRDNTSIVGVDRYSQKIQGILGSSVLNANKLTFRSSDVEKEIKEFFPEVSDVSVDTFILGKKPNIRLTVMELPLKISVDGKDYLVAENGKLVGKTTDFSLIKNTVTVRDETGFEPEIGSSILRSDDMHFVITLKKLLGEKGITLEYVKIPVTPREIYVKAIGKNYEVRMFLEDDPYAQVGSWLATEKVVGERGETISRYIDVRAGEKVFWL